MVTQFRAQPVETRDELMKAFVSEVYNTTKQGSDDFDSDDMQTDNDLTENEVNDELLRQIADAIAFEMEQQDYLDVDDNNLLELEEAELSEQISIFQDEDNTIICPLCRYTYCQTLQYYIL